MPLPQPSLPMSGRRLAMAALLLSTLTACGYKGPLYMPPPPPPDASLTAPPSSIPPDTTEQADPSNPAASNNTAEPQ